MNLAEERSAVPIVVASTGPLLAALAFAAAPDGQFPIALIALAFVAPVVGGWRLASGDLNAVRLTLLLSGLVISGAALADAALSPEPSSFAINLAAAPLAAVVVCWIAATPTGRRSVVLGGVVLLAALSAYSILLWGSGAQTGVGTDLGGEDFSRRIFPGSFGHPNQFAVTLGLLLPLTLALAVAPCSWRRRVPLLTVTLMGGVALALTYSRNLWIAVAIALAIVCLMSRFGKVLLAASVVVLLAVAPFATSRFTETDLAGGRFEIWAQAIEVIRDHPLAGVGIEGFARASGSLVLPETADAPPHAHSLYLAAASELGIPAALALVVVLATLLIALARRTLVDRGEIRPIAAGCLGAVVVIVVGGMFDAVVFHNVPTLFLAAAVLGLGAAATAGASVSRGRQEARGNGEG